MEGMQPTVAIIDNDERVREVLVRILGAEGYPIIMATSNAEAPDLIESLEDRPDIALWDPDFDSDHFLAAQRRATIAELLLSRGVRVVNTALEGEVEGVTDRLPQLKTPREIVAKLEDVTAA
jgi:DNA-binding response OmpR family regulator